MDKDAKGVGEDKKVVRVRIRKKQEPVALFSQKDIRKFVIEFVSLWIRGDITIRFPSAVAIVCEDLTGFIQRQNRITE
jgi:hypothetical protein